MQRWYMYVYMRGYKEKQNRDGILKSIVSRYSYTIFISTENLLSEIKDHLCVRDY